MANWLELARGPIFLACLAFMVLSVIRYLALMFLREVHTVYLANNRKVRFGQTVLALLKCLFPFHQLRHGVIYCLTAFFFLLLIVITPLLLKQHIYLIESGTGLSWTGMPNEISTRLTFGAIIMAIALIMLRIDKRNTRPLRLFHDFALPVMIVICCFAGFFMMHPTINPFPHQLTFLVHVMSANLVLVLFPLAKLIGKGAGRFTLDADEQQALSLAKESEAL